MEDYIKQILFIICMCGLVIVVFSTLFYCTTKYNDNDDIHASKKGAAIGLVIAGLSGLGLMN